VVRRGRFAGIAGILGALGEAGRREGKGEEGAMLTSGFGQGLGR